MPSTLISLRTFSDPTRARLMHILQDEELSVAETDLLENPVLSFSQTEGTDFNRFLQSENLACNLVTSHVARPESGRRLSGW